MLDGVTRRRLRLPGSGQEIALLDWGGTGPLALLHHANGFCAALWGPVAEGLRETFRVVALDARGHGNSSKPRGVDAYHWRHFGHDAAAVARLLLDTHGAPALGLGHSFGGTALLLAALEEPGLFSRLLLLDPIVVPATPEARARTRGPGLAENARKRRVVWESRDEARERWAGKEMFAGWDPRALELYLAEALGDRADGRVELKCSGETEAWVYENNASVDVLSLVPALRAETRIAWARRGHFPRAHFEALAARMPRGDVVDTGTGHFIPMEDPAWVARAALAFSAPSGSRGSSIR